MPLRTRKAASNAVDINMSAMIDVVFLLLIYFIVTYQDEIPEAHLAVNLPSGESKPSTVEPELLKLQVLPGEYTLRNKTLTLGTIERVLQGLAASSPDVTVIIQVSQSARTKNLIRLLDVCKEVGLTNLNVVKM
ncbi:MAG: biopolymer transporter ExbD [Candidatus Pacebacteria bacterium]|nr:biopolymer transporter ExbD [Candidatus Paceibacterota bacterium]